MGDREVTTRRSAVERHVLRIRTIAVTFSAAVRSAHRDMDVGPAERDALVEAWRIWCLDALDGYAAEAERLTSTPEAGSRDLIDRELEVAYRTVRDA